MNVIITGATGFIGGEVVRQAISSDKIRHAFVLARKPISEELAKSEKITVIQHEDFSSYPPELLAKLEGADGCLWALGGRATQFPDLETARRVSVEYTLAAAKAFLSLANGRKFRFLFCSGKFAEWDQTKQLAFMADTRRIKGEVEKGLCELADANPDNLEVWIVRPSGILPADAGFIQRAAGKVLQFPRVDGLARAMIRIISDGHADRIVENETLLVL